MVDWHRYDNPDTDEDDEEIDSALSHPHFTDRMSQAFVTARLVQRHGVKLSFIQVTHRPLALFLSQGHAGVQRVLERVSVQKKPELG